MYCASFMKFPNYQVQYRDTLQITSFQEIDPVAQFLMNWLPAWLAVRINRWKAVLLGALFYQYCVR